MLTSLILSIALCGQGETTESKKDWLLANLVVEHNFNTEKMHEVEKKLSNMSSSQINVLVEVYKQSEVKRQQSYDRQEQALLNQAKFNLEKAQAYKEHLGREFEMTMQIKKQELEVLRVGSQYLNYAQSWAMPRVYSFGGYGYNGGWGGYGNGFGGWGGYGGSYGGFGYNSQYGVGPNGLYYRW